MSDNPPAFPVAAFGPADDLISQPGMSLRDWFAGQALAGFLADGSQRLVNEACKAEPEFLDMGPVPRTAVINEQIAIGCYALADAMLAERQRVLSGGQGK